MGENLIHSRTCVYNINYHVVWSVKYRKKILTVEVEAYLKELVQQIADEKGFTVHLFEVGEGDHIHCFVSGPPKLSITDIVKSAALKIFRFESLNKEWLEFVKENRSRGGLQHDYDVVFGPVADDNTMETVQLYLSGVLTADEAVNRLRYTKVNNQISFHTEEALKYLRLVGRSEYHGRDLYI